jgi:iduronate 2-sulfatase
MKKIICLLWLWIASLNCFSAADKPLRQVQSKPNILFIAVDDLRVELGCYGSEIAITPNLDALAAQGLLFNRAYCQQAICGASRASLLSGTRPDTNGIVHNYVRLRELNPDILTLPQHFIANGYQAAYTGKIFHHGDLDDELSWNRKPATSKVTVKNYKFPRGYALPENQKIANENMEEMLAKYGETAKRGLGSGPAYESADVPDYAYSDGYNTELAIATMKEILEEGDKPFFLGLGFNKPHLNWVSPKRYWDLYDREKIPMTNEPNAPENAAAMGVHASFELRTRAGIPKFGPIDPELARTLKHAYLACVSYVDAQIGKMIAALEEAGVRDNTIIIVWSDHGWHLGDMGIWGKATNFEIATRVPMMIWTPDMPQSTRGKKTDALVELIDMYPTLCDLAGVDQPSHLEGHSFTPLLENPERNWKRAAFSQFPNPALREWGSYPLMPEMRETWFGPLIEEVEGGIIDQQEGKWDRKLFEHNLMGYAMRTNRYRFVAWKDTTHPKAAPIAVELYDHKNDPTETKNIADKKPKIVENLLKQLNAGWKGALPKS